MPHRRIARSMAANVEEQADNFGRLWEHYGAAELSTEAPHRQRTAVNRLLGYALFLGWTHRDPGETGRAFAGIKAWQKMCGRVRDLDVIREWAARCAGEAGGAAKEAAAAFERDLAAQRRAAAAVLSAEARGFAGAQARVAMATARHELLRFLAHWTSTGAAVDPRAALEAVEGPWRESLAALSADHGDVPLHAFRVKNKRLRFVLDILAEGKDADPALRERAKLAAKTHTILGTLQDLLVTKDALRLARARWAGERPGLADSAAALESGRLALEAAELSRWFRIWPELATR